MNESNRWALEVAATLKQVQTDFSDEEPEKRHQYLKDTLEQSMHDFSGEQKAERLRALSEQFPVLGGSGGKTRIEYGQSPSASSKEQEDEGNSGIDGVVFKIKKILTEGAPSDRNELLQKLDEAGLKEIFRTSSMDENALPRDIQKRLGLRPGSKVNVENVFKLLTYFVETILTIDKLVWAFLKKAAPKSSSNRTTRGDVRLLLGKFIVADPNTSYSQVTEAIDNTRNMNTGLLGSIGFLGKSFAKRFSDRLSPNAIVEVAEAEGIPWHISKEGKYWEKYSLMAEEMNEVALEKIFDEMIVTHAEELVGGADRVKQTK